MNYQDRILYAMQYFFMGLSIGYKMVSAAY
jgi:hypothetical protein